MAVAREFPPLEGIWKRVDQCAKRSKAATGWKKWLYGALAGVLAAVAALSQTGCAELGITPRGVVQAHEAYHVLTGTECKIRVVEHDK